MGGPDGFHQRLHHVRPGNLDPETAQTSGMHRLAAISGSTVGSSAIWMGQTHVAAATRSGDHHHGESETAIYIVSGQPVFVFHSDGSDGQPAGEVRIETHPGDYIFVPPYLPHREENPDPDHEAVVVIARSTQEAIVVNVPNLAARPDQPD